jgi:Ni/Co efflux regulator RcnB
MKLPHFHKNMRAQRRFRLGSYRAPHGYHYRRWAFGMFLPEIYFAQDYWISDYSDYDLDDPPDGYVWVRYGPDALLIDEDTGEIVEVEYGVFY